MITQKNNLANPLESKSVPELVAEGTCHNVPLEFTLSLHNTPMTTPLCLYLHLYSHNVDQAVTQPHFPEVPQEQAQPQEQQKQNWQKPWLHEQSDKSNFQEETSFKTDSWVTTGS